jgi:hypothetical protein
MWVSMDTKDTSPESISLRHGRRNSGCFARESSNRAVTVVERKLTAVESEGQRSRSSIPIGPFSLTYPCISSITMSPRALICRDSVLLRGRTLQHYRLAARWLAKGDPPSFTAYGDVPILTSPNGLISMFEQFRDSCSTPCESR